MWTFVIVEYTSLFLVLTVGSNMIKHGENFKSCWKVIGFKQHFSLTSGYHRPILKIGVWKGRPYYWEQRTYTSFSSQMSALKVLIVSSRGCPVTKSGPTLCNPRDCSTPGLPVLRHLPELAQTQVHWVSDAIQPSHPLSSPFPPALNLSQHQSLPVSRFFTSVRKLQLQHQSF